MTVITREVAHHLLWVYDHADADAGVGYPPGSFVTKLLAAIVAADEQHKDRLALGYPGYVEAVRIMQDEGPDRLVAIARGEAEAEQEVTA